MSVRRALTPTEFLFKRLDLYLSLAMRINTNEFLFADRVMTSLQNLDIRQLPSETPNLIYEESDLKVFLVKRTDVFTVYIQGGYDYINSSIYVEVSSERKFEKLSKMTDLVTVINHEYFHHLQIKYQNDFKKTELALRKLSHIDSGKVKDTFKYYKHSLERISHAGQVVTELLWIYKRNNNSIIDIIDQLLRPVDFFDKQTSLLQKIHNTTTYRTIVMNIMDSDGNNKIKSKVIDSVRNLLETEVKRILAFLATEK